MSGNLNLQNNGSYSLNIENLDKTYVVHYDGEYLNGTDEVDFNTNGRTSRATLSIIMIEDIP